MFEKLQWRQAWASEMSALENVQAATGTPPVLPDTRPVSDRFFRMWRVTAGWNPISAADFLAANRGQVQVAIGLPRRG